MNANYRGLSMGYVLYIDNRKSMCNSWHNRKNCVTIAPLETVGAFCISGQNKTHAAQPNRAARRICKMARNPESLKNLKPGNKRGPNKTTSLIKDAIIQAAENAGGNKGMVGYLTLQAMENPGPFMSLLGKVLPTQTEITGKDGGAIQTENITASEILKEKLDAIASRAPSPTAGE
jgi:hypothetical protein